MTAPAAPPRRRPFLTARWESLVLLNFACRREWLEPLVPSGTELDTWHGESLVSLVGFLFTDTRLLGVPVPFHRTFEEVNLRFYVRRPGPDGVMRRAVVFIRELVPRVAIAWTARAIYNEPYLAVPMSHEVELDPTRGGHVQYGWRHRGRTFTLDATTTGPAVPLEPGSEAEFITEHYWGYTRQRDGGTLEVRSRASTLARLDRRNPRLPRGCDGPLRSPLRRPAAHPATFGVRGRGLRRRGACGRPHRITASHRCHGVLCHNPEP